MTKILTALALVAMLAGCGDGLDSHAKKACEQVAKSDAVHDRTDPSSLSAMTDAAVASLVAVSEAKKSTDEGLRKAAESTDLGSELPHDNPLYRNPADVQFAAVRDWCRAHG